MSKKSDAKTEALERKLNDAINNAVHVANEVDLKTAIGKKSIAIISSDQALYERLLNKFPKENVVAGTKATGKALITLGAAITALSFGAFAFIGVPMAGAGAVMSTAGIVLDDYKDYSLFLDYDAKSVLFLKVKGTPRIEIRNAPKKLNK